MFPVVGDRDSVGPPIQMVQLGLQLKDLRKLKRVTAAVTRNSLLLRLIAASAS